MSLQSKTHVKLPAIHFLVELIRIHPRLEFVKNLATHLQLCQQTHERPVDQTHVLSPHSLNPRSGHAEEPTMEFV